MSKKGHYLKYNITKADGTPCDESADYFVLRLDTDPHARAAARAYSESCKHENMELASDLLARVTSYEIEQAKRESNPGWYREQAGD